jgi:RNA polymerase primary sigma factor
MAAGASHQTAIARAYRASSVPFADVVQEGTIGLVRAAERFDHRRGVKFSTYAVWWIRRSILDAIAGANLIRIPAEASQQLTAVRRAEAELARIESRRASDVAIAEHAQLSITTVRCLREAARVTASLDEPVGGDATPLAAGWPGAIAYFHLRHTVGDPFSQPTAS